MTGILRDKTIGNKLMYISLMMINKIVRSVNKNYQLKSLDTASLNQPIKIFKNYTEMKSTNEKTCLLECFVYLRAIIFNFFGSFYKAYTGLLLRYLGFWDC